VQVTIYTRPHCFNCQLLKRYLDEKGVRYQERDVSTDEAALRDVERIHAGGVPVTVIDGLAVLGFDKIRLDDELKARGVRIAEGP